MWMRTIQLLLVAAVLGCGEQDYPLDPCGDDDHGDDDTAMPDDDVTGDDDTSDDDNSDDDSADDDTGDDDSAEPLDADGDGWPEGEDCDDHDPTVGPHMGEICDGVDNDCDTDIDEDCLACDIEVPGDHTHIQNAIESYNYVPGVVICVDPGTYTENLDLAGQVVHLLGVGGPELTIVDGDAAGPVVRFDSGEGPDTVLEGFTLTNGSAQKGGGIYVAGASPTLADLIVEGNAAVDSGGGIYASSTSLSMVDVQVRSNESLYDGGGLSLVASTPVLAGVVVEGNGVTHGDGGGIYMSGTDGSIRETTVRDNVSLQWGGGIYMLDSNPSVTAAVVSDNTLNTTVGAGAGAALHGSAPTLTDLVVRDNFSESFDAAAGGGISMGFESAPVLHNVLVTGNTAVGGWWGGYGGGLYVSHSTPVLHNVIVSGNLADDPISWGHGGGVFLGDSTATLVNVAVVGNTGSEAAGGIHMEDSDLWMTNVAVSHNNGEVGISGHDSTLQMRYSNVYNSVTQEFEYLTDPTGTDGNVSVASEFLDGAPADPYDWDLHIAATSPLVDAGDPTLLDPDGSPSDIGAYGGEYADSWDLDWDGYPEWWLPGPYSAATSPGLDCDDRDADVYPGQGC